MNRDAEKFDGSGQKSAHSVDRRVETAVDTHVDARVDTGVETGVETSAETTAETGVSPRSPIVAITASTLVHALIAFALVAMGVTAARAMRREAPPILVAEWTPPPPIGIAPSPPELPIPGGAIVYQGPAARGVFDSASGARAAADRLERLAPPIAVTANAAGRFGGQLGFGGALPERFRAASFAMDKQRVAFLIDGGGRLLSALPAARSVLAQRLAALMPTQQFTVAIARGNGVELAPGTPAAATRANTAAALRWFTERSAPGGTPDLGAALESRSAPQHVAPTPHCFPPPIGSIPLRRMALDLPHFSASNSWKHPPTAHCAHSGNATAAATDTYFSTAPRSDLHRCVRATSLQETSAND
jgi:hypothetical protein